MKKRIFMVILDIILDQNIADKRKRYAIFESLFTVNYRVVSGLAAEDKNGLHEY